MEYTDARQVNQGNARPPLQARSRSRFLKLVIWRNMQPVTPLRPIKLPTMLDVKPTLQRLGFVKLRSKRLFISTVELHYPGRFRVVEMLQLHPTGNCCRITAQAWSKSPLSCFTRSRCEGASSGLPASTVKTSGPVLLQPLSRNSTLSRSSRVAVSTTQRRRNLVITNSGAAGGMAHGSGGRGAKVRVMLSSNPEPSQRSEAGQN